MAKWGDPHLFGARISRFPPDPFPPPIDPEEAVTESLKRTVEELQLELDCERQKVARLESELVRERVKQSAVTTLRSITWQYEMDGSWHAFPPEGNVFMASRII